MLDARWHLNAHTPRMRPVRYSSDRSTHTHYEAFQLANKRQTIWYAVRTTFASYEPASLLGSVYGEQQRGEGRAAYGASVTCRAKEIHLLTI